MSSHCSPSSFSKARVGCCAGAAARPDDREPALELLAVEAELELAVLDALAPVERRRLRLPRPPVPDDDVAGAVLLGRDDAFEIEVFDRVVLDVDGHAPGLRVERRALRDGPADEDAVDLEPEVVVEPGRSVALDDEPPALAAGRRLGDRGRLRGLPKSRLRRYSSRGTRGVCPSRVRPGDAAGRHARTTPRERRYPFRPPDTRPGSLGRRIRPLRRPGQAKSLRLVRGSSGGTAHRAPQQAGIAA